MPTTRQCVECGTPLPESAPDGSCPACILHGALAMPDETSEAVVAERPGDRIGRYKLLEKIGEGGCGIVYMAEQAEPIRRRVALKVIKLGMETKQVIARFEAERQALALMDHPNIARVLDAGATERGRPYFVMELVRGTRITDYCDQHNLSTRQRLDLFVQVCHAVQHAHQKGIIHRDIKPSNILVTLLEGVPVPKVIDFGIAKATQQPLTDKTLFTAFHQFMGTPAYMSPEQVEMSGSDVDTRSDIYTLGVLLYELLTGHTPFEQKDLVQAGFDEMRRLIREQEPPRPSTRLSTLAAADLTAVAKRQQTEPPRLIHLVRGDLDWIVMRCLEKERARRYETANDLAHDIERHLNHQPVSAAAPSAVYRMRKFVRRHRVGLAMAAGLFALFAVGVAGIAWQAVRETRAEREQSQLRREAEKAQKDTEEQKRRVEAALADAREQRQRAETSLSDMEKEKTQKEIAFKESQEQKAIALTNLFVAKQEKASKEEALNVASNATGKAEAALRESSDQRARLEEINFMLFDLSDKLLQPIGRADLLRTLTDKILAHYKSLPEKQGSDESLSRRFTAYKNLGHILAIQGESTKAVEAYRSSLAIVEELAPGVRAQTNWQAELCVCHEGLGEIYDTQGDADAALKELQTSLDIAQSQAIKFPLDTQWQAFALAIYLKMGDVLRSKAETAGAFAAYESALNLASRLAKLDPDNTTWQRDLAASYSKTGSLLLQEWGVEKALESTKNGLTIAQNLALKHPENTQWQADLAFSHDNVGDVLLADKDTRRALQNYQRGLEIRQRLVQNDPGNATWGRDLVRSNLKIGRALALEGKKSKAAKLFMEQVKVIEDFPMNQFKLAGKMFIPENKTAKPLEAFGQSLHAAQQLAEKDPRNAQWQEDLAETHSLLGDTLLQAREPQKALEHYQAALKIRKELADRNSGASFLQYWLALSHANVAVALRRFSREDEALLEARDALRAFDSLASRWPGNFVFAEGTRTSDGAIKNRSISPEQRDEISAVFRKGYSASKSRAARGEPKLKDDWANYCSEISVERLLAGQIAEAELSAQTAVEIWQSRAQAERTNTFYATRLKQARLALAAFQLLNRQSAAAIQTARQGLEVEPARVEFKAIIAMACLFDGQYEQARTILMENKDLKVGSMQTFAEAVLDDLHRFSDKRMVRLDFQKIEGLLKAQ